MYLFINVINNEIGRYLIFWLYEAALPFWIIIKNNLVICLWNIISKSFVLLKNNSLFSVISLKKKIWHCPINLNSFFIDLLNMSIPSRLCEIRLWFWMFFLIPNVLDGKYVFERILMPHFFYFFFFLDSFLYHLCGTAMRQRWIWVK